MTICSLLYKLLFSGLVVRAASGQPSLGVFIRLQRAGNFAHQQCFHQFLNVSTVMQSIASVACGSSVKKSSQTSSATETHFSGSLLARKHFGCWGFGFGTAAVPPNQHGCSKGVRWATATGTKRAFQLGLSWTIRVSNNAMTCHMPVLVSMLRPHPKSLRI